MKVFVLQDNGDYYGPYFYGVYSTRAEAEEAAQNRQWEDGGLYPIDRPLIQEIEVDAPGPPV